MQLPLAAQIESHEGRKKLIAVVYSVVGVPFIAWLWILGGFSAATVLGSLVPASAVSFLLLVRRKEPWVWIYPLGVAPFLTCLAGAEASHAPALFMVLLMGPAGISGLHDDRRSVAISWVFCAFGFGILAHAQDPGPWGWGAAAIASVMHLTISLVVFFKAEQHRAALGAAIGATEKAEVALAVAQEAVKTRERFLANMTHELRTPLSGIIGLGQLLPAGVSPEVREIMDTINLSAMSLMEIVNDVLIFSKGKSGTLELRRAPFAPASSIREAVRSIGSQAPRKDLELLLDLAPNLPDSMIGDELRFRQVVINLVGNALKFTSKGTVQVKASLQSTPLSLCVEVIDTGIGIHAKRLASVFEAFVQVDNSDARRFGGTGLGLAITSQLVGLMGGTLQVESKPGVGSTFRFSVPLEAGNTRVPLVTLDAWLEGRRVALVPAQEGGRVFLKKVLEGAGGLTVEAERLAAVPQLLEQARAEGHPFDLAVVDLSADGQWSDVVSAARATPVLALLSAEQRAALAGTHASGVTIIEKPYSAQDLQAAVNRLQLMSKARAKVSESAAERPLDVLVVEDNHINARVAMGLLARLGHRSVLANNGVEALRELAAAHFDIVLMDMQMPEMDGLEATARIRQDEAGTQRHLPIMMVSANTLPEHEAASLSAGADLLMGKPLNMEKLAGELRMLLPNGRRRASQVA